MLLLYDFYRTLFVHTLMVLEATHVVIANIIHRIPISIYPDIEYRIQ